MIEIGDKRLEFFDGPIVQPRRRHLPPTPGVPILPQPPPKPYRTNDENIQKDGIGPVLTKGHMPVSITNGVHMFGYFVYRIYNIVQEIKTHFFSFLCVHFYVKYVYNVRTLGLNNNI